ncbi:hypothetical protein BGW36DRAFT_364426 [Talaromyces proteolyticus]|uniref:DUF302 domain-containing protein n=1 Tax=Talaromyces proteolyticus TaxID=1131652 RepID=A0AAD4KI64_9EURO|nr:uncharacterized protein BGW36DRAFT_364426 [Talaromyces proteolyticus]KAH8690874.1 hypothetical protein BGW36DRAFT_364426 [Talaromyces proteolyticus]
MTVKQTHAFSGSRITFTTPTSFDTVTAKLNAEIESDAGFNQEDVTAAVRRGGKDAFVKLCLSRVGAFGFMKFASIDHSWVQLFGVARGLRIRRILLGNPLIAITMLRQDLDAGLFVPVEVLVKESPERRGTEVLYVLPSSLIAGVNTDDRLRNAARVLDEKLEALIRHITSPDPSKAKL